MPARIIILSNLSLFAQGVTNRLRQHLPQTELEVVDIQQPDLMAQVIAARPSTVLLDITDLETVRFFSLSKLLLSLPATKVIYLDL